ncbi:unnamed protein product [Adineta ricciae]|uniref:Apple domain-containing protein n=1 Tax=Adineta ricciae TaxID=249248 RepID=A0A814KGC7_ADIRI|nr:unnamed protein product [Adineta ricciae]CAF1490162.1 unnamed protein product [Adineta ricciae]
MKYQCNTSDCSASINVSYSNLRQCQILCLSNTQCCTISYEKMTKRCELFSNLPSQYGQLIAQAGVITMIAISGRSPFMPSTANPTVTSTTTISTTAMTASSSATTITSMITRNLIKNGDAETGSCTPFTAQASPPLWFVNGSLSQTFYNGTALNAFLKSSPTPSDYGNCYFGGYTSASTTMQQTGDVNDYINFGPINNRTVKFSFSAWLGGYINQDDNARISLTFSNATYAMVGSVSTLGPVLAADRKNVTTLLFRQVNGTVPARARYFTVLMTMVTTVGGYNSATADNICLILYV